MKNHSSETWVKLHTDWKEHWANKPNDYTLTEWLDKFWDERGGRELYYPEDKEN